jgi:hypothetical protein
VIGHVLVLLRACDRSGAEYTSSGYASGVADADWRGSVPSLQLQQFFAQWPRFHEEFQFSIGNDDRISGGQRQGACPDFGDDPEVEQVVIVDPFHRPPRIPGTLSPVWNRSVTFPSPLSVCGFEGTAGSDERCRPVPEGPQRGREPLGLEAVGGLEVVQVLVDVEREVVEDRAQALGHRPEVVRVGLTAEPEVDGAPQARSRPRHPPSSRPGGSARSPPLRPPVESQRAPFRCRSRGPADRSRRPRALWRGPRRPHQAPRSAPGKRTPPAARSRATG